MLCCVVLGWVGLWYVVLCCVVLLRLALSAIIPRVGTESGHTESESKIKTVRKTERDRRVTDDGLPTPDGSVSFTSTVAPHERQAWGGAEVCRATGRRGRGDGCSDCKTG